MQSDANKEKLIAALKQSIVSIEGGLSHEGCPDLEASSHQSSQQPRDTTVFPNQSDEQCSDVLPPENNVSNDEEKAYQKILRILNYRDRTSYEIRKKLLESDFSAQATEDAIAHACRLNLVNDERFSRNFIEQQHRSGKGKRAAINELKKKGILETDILSYLEESSYAEEDESSRAFAYLEAHPPRGKNLRESAFRKLVSKGYSVNAASSAARSYCEKQM